MGAVLLLMGAAACGWAQRGVDVTENYSRLDLSFEAWQPVSVNGGMAMVSNHSLYGAGLGYVYGFNVTGHTAPLSVEVGPKISFARRQDEIDYWDDDRLTRHEDISTQMLALNVPINLTYQHRLTVDVILAPTAGLNAKVNLLATTRCEGETTDLMDHGGKRLQWGWNAGCGVYLGRYYAGLRYSADLTPFATEGTSKERYQSFDLSIGLRF